MILNAAVHALHSSAFRVGLKTFRQVATARLAAKKLAQVAIGWSICWRRVIESTHHCRRLRGCQLGANTNCLASPCAREKSRNASPMQVETHHHIRSKTCKSPVRIWISADDEHCALEHEFAL